MAWPMSARIEKQARRMSEMMARLKVDSLALARARGGNGFAEARNRCIACGTSEECKQWLEKPEGAAGGPDFCPNWGLFRSLEREPAPKKAVS
jgi:hypothetical protein